MDRIVFSKVRRVEHILNTVRDNLHCIEFLHGQRLPIYADWDLLPVEVICVSVAGHISELEFLPADDSEQRLTGIAACIA